MGRLFKQKVSEEIEPLNNTLHQINIIDIYRAFLSKKWQIIHSSQVHIELSQGQTIFWGTKLVSINLTRLKSYQLYFSTTEWKWKLTTRKKAGTTTNMWTLNDMILINVWVKEKLREEWKDTQKQMIIIKRTSLRDAAKAVLREVYSITGLPQGAKNSYTT